MSYPKVGQFKSTDVLRRHLEELGVTLPVDDEILSAAQDSPLAAPLDVAGVRVGNRWCIHPMEGWDAHRDGSPSAHTLRRWHNFGRSGAKLIWGGEAAAVQPDGRANPHQTLAVPDNRSGLASLLAELERGHRDAFGSLEGLLVGLQLTHSGRFCRPNRKDLLEPRIAYHHPLLDSKFGIDPSDTAVVWTDDDLERLIDSYVAAARLARDVGFRFVDIKACHGYLIHEFLSARRRAGKFGGDFDGRTRLLRTIIGRVRNDLPDLMVGVRLSVFDVVPFRTGTETGRPMDFGDELPYDLGFGTDANDPLQMDLTEPLRLIGELRREGISMINVSCGSPYYNPHIQRPAMFPPSDGYRPPEDPLVGAARLIGAARRCKEEFPELPMVGTGFTYLQDFLPHVAQAVVREKWMDFVGLGRMVLSYPDLPADTLSGRALRRKSICRTFSECTTAPRNGLVSGCFPLDDYYKGLEDAKKLRELKRGSR